MRPLSWLNLIAGKAAACSGCRANDGSSDGAGSFRAHPRHRSAIGKVIRQRAAPNDQDVIVIGSHHLEEWRSNWRKHFEHPDGRTWLFEIDAFHGSTVARGIEPEIATRHLPALPVEGSDIANACGCVMSKVAVASGQGRWRRIGARPLDRRRDLVAGIRPDPQKRLDEEFQEVEGRLTTERLRAVANDQVDEAGMRTGGDEQRARVLVLDAAGFEGLVRHYAAAPLAKEGRATSAGHSA